MPFPVFNGYNGFLDKKEKKKKIKKKREERRGETIPIIDDDDNDVARHGSARLPLGALQDPERAVYCDRGLGEKGVLDACVQICSTSLSLSLCFDFLFFSIRTHSFVAFAGSSWRFAGLLSPGTSLQGQRTPSKSKFPVAFLFLFSPSGCMMA